MIRKFIILFPLITMFTVAFAGESTTDSRPAYCIGGAVAILAVFAVFSGALSANRKTPEPKIDVPALTVLPNGIPTNFQMGILSEKKDLGSGNMDCLIVKIRGLIRLPSNMLSTSFTLTMWDVTSGTKQLDRKAVLCSLPDLQMTGTQVFLWTHVLQMPQAFTAMNKWVDILSIPIDLLTFPERGKRKLLFEISIAPLMHLQNPSATASYTYTHNNLVLGYVDGMKIRIKAEEMGLKYAAAVGAIDGTLDDVEKTVVRKWMDIRIDSLPENMRADTTRSLSRALMIAERLAASIKPSEIEMLCDDIAEEYPIGSFPKGELFDIIELCMKVAAADGVANPEELKLVDRIASLLGVDQERVKKMSEKILPVNMHSEKDIDSILGLQPGWTSKQKKKHLREQYREWSARVTHSDVKVRDQADEMLRLIAGERAKIDAEM